MLRALSITFVMVAVAAAGCLDTGKDALSPGTSAQLPDEGAVFFKPGPQTGTMTAKATERTDEGRSGTPVLPTYYAERMVTVEGDAKLNKLPVDLKTFHGDINVTGVSGDTWRADIRLRAEGATKEDAKASLDLIKLDWNYAEGDRYHLKVDIRSQGTPAGIPPTPVPLGPSPLQVGSIDLRLPRTVLLDLMAETPDGTMNVLGVPTQVLDLENNQGPIMVAAAVANVSIAAMSGNHTLKLWPWMNGTIDVNNGAGNLLVEVAEDATHGYDARAESATGKANITLRDGTVQQSDGGKIATFRTNTLEQRRIQADVTLRTTSGDVLLQPLSERQGGVTGA